MQQFFNNRYAQLTGLAIGLSLLFFIIIWLVATSIGMKDFPIGLEVILAMLAAGIVVYKVFASRVF